MKTLVIFSLCVCTFFTQKISASDTLYIVTGKGNYLLDVEQKNLVPVPESFNSKILFSTEGLPHLVEMKDKKISYDFQKKKTRRGDFDWWSLSIFGAGEVVNFDTKPEGSGYVLCPLTWSSDSSSIYFFSTNQDALNNERGIFKYNFLQKTMREIVPADSYSRLPLVNDERTACYFLREDTRGQRLVMFDLENTQEKVLFHNLSILRLGIVSNFGQGLMGGTGCAVDQNQPELKSPFKPFVGFCVTRMGFDDVLVCTEACPYQSNLCSSMPYCEGHCSLGCTNCRDAVDMDVLIENYLNKTIVASQDGYVVRAQSNCPLQGMGQGYGFGYHAVIRHGDVDDVTAPETLYAHMSEIYVEEGEFVYSGQYIGRLGNSQVNDCNGDGTLDCECGNSNGEHIHYEYHGGNGGLYSTTDIFAPVFSDVGSCVMQPNNSYTTNFDGVGDVYPSASNYDVVDVECDGQVIQVTLVGETCACCESTWYLPGQEIVGDTVVVIATEEMVLNTCFYFSRSVYSPCVSTTSSTDAISICLTNQDLAHCVPGCNDENACNYNPLATYDDGSCDFACYSYCEHVDLNEDNVINFQDLMFVINSIGSEGVADINNDGEVGISDLMIIFSFFGEVCE